MSDKPDAEPNYPATGSDTELIDEFRRNPIGHHSPALQRLLNRLRGAPMAGKYCLVTEKVNQRWRLAKTTGVRGAPLKLLDKRFDSMAEAEWYVFRQRWQELTGERLSP